MSLAITHFAIGVSLTCALLLVSGRYRTPGAPLLVYLGGIFAMMPDIWRFVPFITRDHHSSIWANVFAGHRFFDQLDPGDSHEFAFLLVGVMGVSVCLLSVWLYQHQSTHTPRASASQPADD